MAKIDMPHVPYRGASLVLNDLIPGRVDVYFASGSLLENVRAGQIRVLGVTGTRRDAAAPEVPTISEAGLPGYEVMSWQALFVASRTPPAIVEKIHNDVDKTLADPAVRVKLQETGYAAVGSNPAELRRMLEMEIVKWRSVIKDARLKAEPG